MIKLFFYILLLLMNVSLSNAFAQNNAKNQNSYLKAFLDNDTALGWKPLVARQQKMNPNPTESDLKELQSLSYLQGYNPVPNLKNVTLYDKKTAFPGYNLFISANLPRAILMDMNGKTIHQWDFPCVSLPYDHRYSDNNWGRVRILKNGDLLALIPFGGLLKIDKKSNLIWFRNMICHHDFDIDENGNIYILTVKNSKSGASAGIKINAITVVSPDGQIIKEISLYDLFKKYPDPVYINKINASVRHDPNNKKHIFNIPGDAFHANSIQVLDGKWVSRNPAFKKGNLLISVHNLGLIICVDPDKEKIVWLMDKTFWNRWQHFAKMINNGDILIFDNFYRHDLSRVVEFNPFTRKIVWEYSGPNGRFYSTYLGEEYRLPNGNTLITESDNGHSFEVTPDKKIVWEFYNPNQINSKPDPSGRYNKLIAVTTQMQRIPIDSTLDWLADDQTGFLKRLADISRHVQWHPLHTPASSAVEPAAISAYQSLSYLQGYNPAPRFKNVTYNNSRLAYNGYNLFVSAHTPEASLLNMDGQILHQWHFACASIPNINKEFCPDYWVKARVLDNGDLIAMVPYTGLIKLDKNSNLIWSAPGIFHHDFDIAPNGDIYALSMEKTALNNAPVIMNYVSVYSASGKFIKRISLYDLFKKYHDPSYLQKIQDAVKSNGWSYAPYDQGDVFHANSIQIVTKKEARHSSLFKEGQLLVSVREMGLIMAIDPVPGKIVWLMDAGLWHKGQHFAKLLDNGNILIFDNFYTGTLSRVIEFDPLSRKIIWDFQDPVGPFFSGLIGECYRLPNNNTLITESTNGHTFEVTPDKKIVWEFYNPHRAGTRDSLIAVTYQMQRINRDSTLKWLKKDPHEKL